MATNIFCMPSTTKLAMYGETRSADDKYWWERAKDNRNDEERSRVLKGKGKGNKKEQA